MKKMLSIVCSMVLLIAPFNVNAQEVSGYGSADTTVTYHVDSEWCVMIPETLTADGTEYSFTASQMDLCDGDIVEVSVSGITDGFITLTNTSGGTTTAQMFSRNYDGAVLNNFVIASFGNGQYQSEPPIYILADQNTLPGDYTGTVTFNINLSHFEG